MVKLTRNEFRVGLFVFIPTLIIVLFVILKLGYSVASTTMDVYLKIDSISSIKKGTPVKIKGYTMGRVVNIQPVYKPALHFLATMRIKQDVVLFENCSAVIQNQNILGDPVIELSNPERIGLPLLSEDVIEGIEYVSLESVMQDVHVLLTTLTNTVGVFKQISLDSKHDVHTLIADLSKTVKNVNGILLSSQKDIVQILGSFRETAKTMNEISKELKKHPVKFLFKGKE